MKPDEIPAENQLSSTGIIQNIVYYLFASAVLIICITKNLPAQNPIVTDQFTADPSARVFKGRVYVYPSHDILAGPGRGRAGWFCMEDYHVFSSENLVDWTDHGVIVSQYTVPWVDSTSCSLWAPDCIQRNGRYYFYFPARAKDRKVR
ncbi:MAG: family 43 glycosylhydrolase, partial [bacterium]